MAHSRMRTADDAEDARDPNYSRPLAEGLIQAYRAIHAGDYAQAAKLIPRREIVVAAPMTSMQRVRALYVRGLIASHDHDDVEALGCADLALEDVIPREDLDAIATLSQLGALALHNLQQFGVATDYYSIALDATRAQEPTSAADPLALFDALDGLASEAFLCGRYQASARFAQAARRVALPGAGHEKRAAGLDWTRALLAWWKGDRFRALDYTTAAMGVYAVRGHPVEQARLSIVLAGILLDMTRPAPAMGEGALATSPALGDALLTMVESHVLRALATSITEKDRAGEGMALLAYARLQLASAHSGEALNTITASEAIAAELHDALLRAQALTARGETLAAMGSRDAARYWYTEAIAALRHSDAKAYEARARRALLIDEEMGDS